MIINMLSVVPSVRTARARHGHSQYFIITDTDILYYAGQNSNTDTDTLNFSHDGHGHFTLCVSEFGHGHGHLKYYVFLYGHEHGSLFRVRDPRTRTWATDIYEFNNIYDITTLRHRNFLLPFPKKQM
jgi:hypothetical protein